MSSPPTSIGGAKASRSLRPAYERIRSPWACAFRALIPTAITPANASSTIQTPSHRSGVGWSDASHAATTAVTPIST